MAAEDILKPKSREEIISNLEKKKKLDRDLAMLMRCNDKGYRILLCYLMKNPKKLHIAIAELNIIAEVNRLINKR